MDTFFYFLPPKCLLYWATALCVLTGVAIIWYGLETQRENKRIVYTPIALFVFALVLSFIADHM